MSCYFGKSAYIHTNTLVNTILRTLSPLTAAAFYTFSSGTISQAVFAAMGRSLVCPQEEIRCNCGWESTHTYIYIYYSKYDVSM